MDRGDRLTRRLVKNPQPMEVTNCKKGLSHIAHTKTENGDGKKS